MSDSSGVSELCLVGVWRVSGTCLKRVWNVSGGCQEGVWKVSERRLGDVWVVGSVWEISESCVWEVFGRCLAGF